MKTEKPMMRTKTHRLFVRETPQEKVWSWSTNSIFNGIRDNTGY